MLHRIITVRQQYSKPFMICKQMITIKKKLLLFDSNNGKHQTVCKQMINFKTNYSI